MSYPLPNSMYEYSVTLLLIVIQIWVLYAHRRIDVLEKALLLAKRPTPPVETGYGDEPCCRFCGYPLELCSDRPVTVTLKPDTTTIHDLPASNQ